MRFVLLCRQKGELMKNKTRNFIALGISAILIFIFLFFLTFISPGYVGVVVDYFGDKKGVDTKEIHVGMHWIPPWKTVYQFPIFEQNEIWEGETNIFDFQTIEGMAVSAEVGITFHLKPDCIPMIFQKYRRGMPEITHIFIRNYVRDAINKAASKVRIEDLYGSGKEAFFNEIETHIKEDLDAIGIVVSRIYLIGRFHFPQSVITALNAKIEAIQRAQQRENELREAEAQAKKMVAEAEGNAQCALLKAEAQSKANKILSQSITKELINWQSVQKWDGKMPQVTSGANPFVNINLEK